MANTRQRLSAFTVAAVAFGCALPKYTERESSADSAGSAGRGTGGTNDRAGNGSSAGGGVAATMVVTGSAGTSPGVAGNAANGGGAAPLVGSNGGGVGGLTVLGSGGTMDLGSATAMGGTSQGGVANDGPPNGGSVSGGTATGGASTSSGSTLVEVCSLTDKVCVGTKLMQCNAQRTAMDQLVATCATDALCQAGLASGTCASPVCAVGTYTCQLANRIPCNAGRTGYDATKPEPCTGGTPVCAGGQCVPCGNGDKDCYGGVPRQCSGNAWVQGTACIASQACAVGDCLDARVARWKMPNEPGSAYNPASYQSVASGTIVRDLVTGLEWQAGVSPSPVPANATDQYCQQLTLGGYHDFRVPTAIELFSLVDFSRTTGLLINTDAFSNTPTVALAEESMLAVDYGTGVIRREISTGLDYAIRCVRSTVGAATTVRYAISGGAVTDNFTGLVWNQANDKSMVYGSTFRSTGCPSTKRVPTVKELMTLVDRTASAAPYIDTTAFPAALSDYYWSITGSNPGYVVDFSTGYMDQFSMSTSAAGRCLL